MKQILFASIGLVSLAVAGTAGAADLPRRGVAAPVRAPAAVYMPAAYNWSGFYAGIVGGWGWGDSRWSNPRVSTGDFDIDGGLELTAAGTTQNRTHFGWALGAGAELGLTPNWTAKIEYLFFDLANRNYFIGSSHGLESNLVRVGVNYKF